MAPGEFNASKLGDPRDDGHFAAAAAAPETQHPLGRVALEVEPK